MFIGWLPKDAPSPPPPGGPCRSPPNRVYESWKADMALLTEGVFLVMHPINMALLTEGGAGLRRSAPVCAGLRRSAQVSPLIHILVCNLLTRC